MKRSIRYSGGDATFSYFKLKRDCYFGFTKIGPFFMARKEKAFLDACHLSAHGRYALDWGALDMNRLDKGDLETLSGHDDVKDRRFPALGRKFAMPMTSNSWSKKA